MHHTSIASFQPYKHTMNTAILVIVLVAAASALPQDVIPVLQRTEVRDSFGQFDLEYLSGDGTRVMEKGRLVPNAEGDGEVLIKEGKVFYTSPEGTPITLTYMADAQGFRAVGDHLPVPVVA